MRAYGSRPLLRAHGIAAGQRPFNKHLAWITHALAMCRIRHSRACGLESAAAGRCVGSVIISVGTKLGTPVAGGVGVGVGRTAQPEQGTLQVWGQAALTWQHGRLV